MLAIRRSTKRDGAAHPKWLGMKLRAPNARNTRGADSSFFRLSDSERHAQPLVFAIVWRRRLNRTTITSKAMEPPGGEYTSDEARRIAANVGEATAVACHAAREAGPWRTKTHFCQN
jgi:hypothetical protein